MNGLKAYWNATIDLFLPRPCAGCDVPLLAHEKNLCLACAINLPLTRYEETHGNPVEQLFWGKVELHAASSLWHFTQGGPVQHIMHKIKYRGDRALATFVGNAMGQALKNNDRFKDIDYVIPVPLHPKRQRKRGFNQSELIAAELATSLDIPMRSTQLERHSKSRSQTRKSRLERWYNVKDVFELSDPSSLNGKHLLLVDDVVTTGATLESCITNIQGSCNARISLYTAAVA